MEVLKLSLFPLRKVIPNRRGRTEENKLKFKKAKSVRGKKMV